MARFYYIKDSEGRGLNYNRNHPNFENHKGHSNSRAHEIITNYTPFFTIKEAEAFIKRLYKEQGYDMNLSIGTITFKDK